MKFVNLFSLCAIFFCGISVANEIDVYYQKVESCIEQEKLKDDLTANDVKINDFKYLPIIKNIRIANCSQQEENDYLNSKASQHSHTLTYFNEQDLLQFSRDELTAIAELDRKLSKKNLEVDLLSIYDKLKEND